MNLLVFTAAFFDRDFYENTIALRESCYRNDIDIKTYGRSETFNFFDSKIVKMGVFLNNNKEKYTHALYVDASDCLFLSGLEEILEKYKSINAPLIVSGEKDIYPFPDMMSNFPEVDSPYRFMNPGMFIGEIPYLLDVISILKSYYFLRTNDQGHWMMAMDDKRISPVIDWRCDIFQTMSLVDYDKEFELRGKRLYNKVTKTTPCVVHFNGPKGESYNGNLMNRVRQELKEAYDTVA